jgi:hypothetical protein
LLLAKRPGVKYMVLRVDIWIMSGLRVLKYVRQEALMSKVLTLVLPRYLPKVQRTATTLRWGKRQPKKAKKAPRETSKKKPKKIRQLS